VRAAIAAAIVLLGATLDLHTAPRQTFRTSVDAVRVDVLVTQDGQPVRGLRAADFEIRDNGVLQQVDLVSFEEVPVNMMLALDLSGSVTETGLGHLRAAGEAVLAGLRHDDRAGLVTFSHVVSERSPLSTDLASLRKAVGRVRSAGGTALIDASQAGMILAESGTGRGLLVIFSDGVDTSSWLSRELVLATARRSEAVVYAVAVGQTADDFLEDLTDLTGGRLLRAETTDKVRALFVDVLEEFRHRYLVSFSPQGVERGGWHSLRVRVRGRRVTVRARPGYGH
jgi:VWFA-related protein